MFSISDACARSYTSNREWITNDWNEEVLLNISWLEKIGIYCIAERRFRMTAYILRPPGHRPSKIAMSWTPDDGRRRRGCPKKTDMVRKIPGRPGESQHHMGRAEAAEHTAMDRLLWRQTAAQCARGGSRGGGRVGPDPPLFTHVIFLCRILYIWGSLFVSLWTSPRMCSFIDDCSVGYGAYMKGVRAPASPWVMRTTDKDEAWLINSRQGREGKGRNGATAPKLQFQAPPLLIWTPIS